MRARHTRWSEVLAGALVLVAGALGAGCPSAHTGTSGPVGLERPGATHAVEAPKTNPRAQKAFERGLRAVADQKAAKVEDWDALAKVWAKVVRDAPEVGEAWHNLGVALERSGDLEGAEEAYHKALKVKPSLRAPAINLAVLEERRGHPERAAKIYQEVLRVYPEDAVARAHLAELVRARGDLPRAEKLAKGALERDAGSAGAYLVLMKIELARRHPDLARLLALKAMKIDPKEPEVHLGLARAALLQKREAVARAELTRVLEMAPGRLDAQHIRLELARRHEDWQGALAALAAILKAEPENAPAWVARGVALRALQRPDEAERAYQKALELDPKLVEAHLDLAILYQRVRQDPKKAREHARAYLAARRGVPPKHVARKVLAEAEQAIQIQAEAARMEAQAKAQEEAARRAEAEAKRKAQEAAEEKAAAGEHAAASGEATAGAEGGADTGGESSTAKDAAGDEGEAGSPGPAAPEEAGAG